MFRIALKSTLARKGRLLLTALAIIAGCAFLSGVFVLSDTIRGSFDRLFANAYENVDAYVRSSNVIEGDFGQDNRDQLPDSLIPEVAALPGVAHADGNIQGFAQIATADGTPIGQQGPPKYGGVFTGEPSSPFSLAEGRPASGPDEVVIDRRSAREGKVSVGDTVRITGRTGVHDFTVTGIALFAGADTSGAATWALFDLPTAQEVVLGRQGLVDAIAVVGDGTLDDAALAASIDKAFAGRDVEALTGKQITEENQSSVQDSLGVITKFLTIFALLSLFVGSFIIYNVFSISAAQRQRENALLRAIGARRAQVTRSLFIEALVVGIVGGLLGFVAGLGLATGILALLTALDVGPTDTALVIKPMSFVVTVVVGVFVTMVCAIAPAIRAGRVPPLAAMRDVAVDRSGLSRGRLLTGLVLLLVTVLGVGLGLTANSLWLAPGIIGLFAALVVLGPLIAAPIARAITQPLARVRGVTGEIAGRNAATSPKRTSLTAGALAIGLALLIGVSTLGASVKSSIRESLAKEFRADFAISPEDGQGFGGLPTTLTGDLLQLPEVENAASLGLALGGLSLIEDNAPVGKTPLVVDPVQAAAVFDLSLVGGEWSSLTPDSVFLSADKAKRDGLAIGDTVTAVLQDRTTRQLTVAATFDASGYGSIIISKDLLAGQKTAVFDVQVLVRSADGVSTADARAAIATVTDRYPTAKLQTRDEFIDSQTQLVNTFLNFIYGLLAMSVFIAILGIVITLLLSVYERRRELGLVRAVGMTRPQVRGSIRWEAFITALLGAAMGIVLGVALGWIVVQAFSEDLTVFQVSVPTIAFFVALSIGFAVVAAWWPARRAAKADILQAIATT